MTTDLTQTHVYAGDVPLFKKLGLRRFTVSESSGREWIDVGTVELDGASVKVEVYCAPAQFFRFTISPKVEDVQGGALVTGSGTLSEYWPSVEKWASGCLGFKAEPEPTDASQESAFYGGGSR